LAKGKSSSKVPLGKGCVSSQEGNQLTASTRILLQKFHLELSPGLVGFKKAADFENSVGSNGLFQSVRKKKTEKSEEFAQEVLFQSTNAWNSLLCKKQNHPAIAGVSSYKLRTKSTKSIVKEVKE